MEQTRADKLREAGIRRYGSLDAYLQSLKDRGRKGGKKTGISKHRGAEHYKSMGKVGADARWGKEKKDA